MDKIKIQDYETCRAVLTDQVQGKVAQGVSLSSLGIEVEPVAVFTTVFPSACTNKLVFPFVSKTVAPSTIPLCSIGCQSYFAVRNQGGGTGQRLFSKGKPGNNFMFIIIIIIITGKSWCSSAYVFHSLSYNVSQSKGTK